MKRFEVKMLVWNADLGEVEKVVTIEAESKEQAFDKAVDNFMLIETSYIKEI